MSEIVRIGTRGSELALAQSELVARELRNSLPGAAVELVSIKTTGDMRQGTPEARLLDKKAWIHELEQALVSGTIDLAVHSGKDVPLEIAENTTCCSVLKRENPFDSFIGRKLAAGGRLSPADLKEDAQIGTASLRRAASLRRWLIGSTPVEHRGNVPTRLRKLDESDTLDGIILAAAGVNRLPELVGDLEHHPLPVKYFVPAIAQGTLVAQFRTADTVTRDRIAKISDRETEIRFLAERACAAELNADCTTAVGIYAEANLQAGSLSITCRVLSLDGKECVEKSLSGSAHSPQEIGSAVGAALIEMGASEIMKKCI